ncbi:putative holin [Microbulbifer sp. ANSA003]|uniref:putative holin n=1 Tax=Microbulbifer sp. ANSA003 TaxID=3243360 RepID=UPI0040421C94
MILPRLSFWLLMAIALLLAIGFFSPQQLPVVLYKTSLVTGAVVLGYWLDRSLFHYARPHDMFQQALQIQTDSLDGARAMRLNASLATLRRTVIILACVLGLTLGL